MPQTFILHCHCGHTQSMSASSISEAHVRASVRGWDLGMQLLPLSDEEFLNPTCVDQCPRCSQEMREAAKALFALWEIPFRGSHERVQ
jgi:hypothetical protein